LQRNRDRDSVRDVLVNQGTDASSISANGFGEDRPVATNDTEAGRQQNRRVQPIISGEIIGNNSFTEPKLNK
jgi:outer membrane protein OmpA-like peptidoglycan-associated protein